MRRGIVRRRPVRGAAKNARPGKSRQGARCCSAGSTACTRGMKRCLRRRKLRGKKWRRLRFRGGKGLPIYTESERDYIFAKSGISEVYPLDFAKIKDMSAAQFALAVKEKIAPAVCFCGEDFRFGAGGKASGEDFEKLSGIPVRALPVLKDENGEKIGAERIKKLLEIGDVQSANALLCGGFILIGEVKKDRGVGAKIGFPTANIDYPRANAAERGRVRNARGKSAVKRTGASRISGAPHVFSGYGGDGDAFSRVFGRSVRRNAYDKFCAVFAGNQGVFRRGELIAAAENG